MPDVTGGDTGYELASALSCLYLIVIDAGADVAAIYCGSDGSTLFVLDVEVAFLRPGLYGELTERLQRMTLHEWHICRCWTFAPKHLVGLLSGPVAELQLDLKPEQLLAFTSEYIRHGRVRFCPAVRERMANRTIASAMTLKAGDPVETALKTALIYAVWVEHGGRQLAA
jgi:hypothetical protein